MKPCTLSAPPKLPRQMTHLPTYPDVQGNNAMVPFEKNEAYAYLTRTLGGKERIPQRFKSIEEGAKEIFMCLRLRYGLEHIEDFASVLAWQLSICKDDDEIWTGWRKQFTTQKVSDIIYQVF